ncbi:3-ketoacyl-CoA synthase 5-like [Apium graveolens]|uniref:3-ketoacyl-CoA synthase 5-like n=1 Tax=Apium graveolens TaxID=4045 RepID=UPI003D7951E9
MSKPRTLYLIDFVCYKAPAEFRVSPGVFIEHSKIIFESEPKSFEFQQKVLERTGLGEETCLPPALLIIPPDPTLEASREEAEMVIFSALDSLFLKTGLSPKDIDILVVNVSILCLIPSLSSVVINKYQMKDDVKSFNISGTGCSGSLVSISLVCDLLQVHPGYNAVVVSAEVITASYYKGKERSMLVPNCLFRMGGAAILFSNLGVWLSKELMAVAGEGLKLNLTALGPLVLPAFEKLRYLVNLIARKIASHRWRPYIPDIKQAFEHFCIHAGGRAVIDGVQDSLQLSMEQVEASRSTLHRFGNTSLLSNQLI